MFLLSQRLKERSQVLLANKSSLLTGHKSGIIMPSILQRKINKQSTLVGLGFVKNISKTQHEANKERDMLAIKQKHAEEEEREKQVIAENKRKRKRNKARVKIEENHKRQRLRNENERGSVLVKTERLA